MRKKRLRDSKLINITALAALPEFDDSKKGGVVYFLYFKPSAYVAWEHGCE
jgi:hypothetical protein